MSFVPGTSKLIFRHSQTMVAAFFALFFFFISLHIHLAAKDLQNEITRYIWGWVFWASFAPTTKTRRSWENDGKIASNAADYAARNDGGTTGVRKVIVGRHKLICTFRLCRSAAAPTSPSMPTTVVAAPGESCTCKSTKERKTLSAAGTRWQLRGTERNI